MGVGSKPVGLTAMFLYQVLCGGCSPGVYAIPQILAGPKATGRWIGIHNSVGSMAGIVAPAVTGFIVYSTHAFTAAFLSAAAVTLLGLIGWLWMLPRLTELDWAAKAGLPAGAEPVLPAA
jgi:nitrate/nitrite transporter NarK